MLANMKEFSRLKALLRIVDDVSRQKTLTDVYETILNQTTGFFGFDFGCISRVDYISRRIETVMCQSVIPKVVDPARWMSLSSYSWDEADILVDVFRTKRVVTIGARSPDEPPDPRLNEQIYTRFNHADLTRIWVPFVFAEEEGSKDAQVLAIIEAGYHPRHKGGAHTNKKRGGVVVFL